MLFLILIFTSQQKNAWIWQSHLLFLPVVFVL